MKIKALTLFIIFYFPHIMLSQSTNWKNYTDMKEVRSAVISDGNIWAATSGGAFSYDFQSNEYKKFHKAEGLTGGRLSCSAVDIYNRIWFGSTTGHLDVYDPAGDNFKSVLDIYNSLKQPKGVNSFFASGDTMFAATDFGISVIDQTTFIFLDTYTTFGNLSSNIKVHNVHKGSLISAALDNSVVVQKPGASNLSAPESWDVYNISNKRISQVTEYNGKITAGTASGLYVLEGNSFIIFIPELSQANISIVKVLHNSLYIVEEATAVTPHKVYKFDGQLNEIFSSSIKINDVFADDNFIYTATSDGIKKLPDSPETPVIKPNTPYSNLFPSMAVDIAGSLWSASGRDATGRGFYQYINESWNNYNMWSVPSTPTNAYFLAYTSGSEVYFGSWGSGFLKLKDNQFSHFDHNNTPMEGITNDPNFLVISGLAKDSKNNLWILNYGSITRENLSLLTPDSIWYNFQIPAMQNQYVDQNFSLIIDQQDTKWFSSRSVNRPGLFYFNENNTFTNAADDKSGYISEGLNEKILSLSIDQRGDIWIGTGLGVNIISNSSAVLTTNPQLRISSVFSLRQQSINCIAVDPLNRKWVGTNQGLILVNSDGTSVITSYTTQNSPLLSDAILSLVIDEQTGTVYVGSDEGLTSFETDAKRPVDTFGELVIYPNPLTLKGQHSGSVTIDGLIRDSEIKILTISGKLITQFSSLGGRVTSWDGKDFNGEYVSSGIYIVVASDKDGNNVMSGKIAVLRE